MASARIDSWLWGVRLYKTRSAAKDAVLGGHVSVNGTKVKPSYRVNPGDQVRATVGDLLRIVEVVEPIEKHVGAPRAAECFIDYSPPPPESTYVAPAGTREQGAGRPTKRDRRITDRLRGR